MKIPAFIAVLFSFASALYGMEGTGAHLIIVNRTNSMFILQFNALPEPSGRQKKSALKGPDIDLHGVSAGQGSIEGFQTVIVHNLGRDQKIAVFDAYSPITSSVSLNVSKEQYPALYTGKNTLVVFIETNVQGTARSYSLLVDSRPLKISLQDYQQKQGTSARMITGFSERLQNELNRAGKQEFLDTYHDALKDNIGIAELLVNDDIPRITRAAVVNALTYRKLSELDDAIIETLQKITNPLSAPVINNETAAQRALRDQKALIIASVVNVVSAKKQLIKKFKQSLGSKIALADLLLDDKIKEITHLQINQALGYDHVPSFIELGGPHVMASILLLTKEGIDPIIPGESPEEQANRRKKAALIEHVVQQIK